MLLVYKLLSFSLMHILALLQLYFNRYEYSKIAINKA